MKRILIPLLIAALLCISFAAAADGNPLAFDTGINRVNEGETLQTVLTRAGDAAAGELTYKSSDERVATVDGDGNVTGVKKGMVTITATVKTETKTYRAQLKMTVVRPVTSLTVHTDKLPLYSADDAKVAPYLSARENAEENGLPVLLLPVKKNLQITVDAEPKDATNRKVILSSSDPAVFTAKGNAVTGAAPGEGILTIASETNPDISVRYRVLVVQPVKKLTIEASAPSVAAGGQITLTAKASPENATMTDVIWSSGDERIATVDAEGTVTGIARGNGRIIAVAADGSGVRANYTVKVVQNPESIELAAGDVTIDVGKTAPAKATILPKNADNKKVIWTSSDESVATVGKDGRIKGVALGECTITCTSQALDSVAATMTVHVQQPVKKLSFDGKEAFAYAGETVQLSWTVEPANATNPGVAFKSSDTRILTVDENGLVTGVKGGKASVEAVTTDGSKRRAKIQVRVGEHVRGVRMVRNNAYIDIGEDATAGADLIPKDAINNHMTWVSSDESVVTATGNTNHKMHLKGIGYGDATVTGTTEDGGYQTSIQVHVGDYDHLLTFLNFNLEDNGSIWLKVRNDSGFTITKITAQVDMFDAVGGSNDPIAINTKNGSNTVDIVWTGTLNPGEVTGKNHWKMVNYSVPEGGIYSTRGTVRLFSYQIDGDWIKTIRKSRRPYKDY